MNIKSRLLAVTLLLFVFALGWLSSQLWFMAYRGKNSANTGTRIEADDGVIPHPGSPNNVYEKRLEGAHENVEEWLISIREGDSKGLYCIVQDNDADGELDQWMLGTFSERTFYKLQLDKAPLFQAFRISSHQADNAMSYNYYDIDLDGLPDVYMKGKPDTGTVERRVRVGHTWHETRSLTGGDWGDGFIVVLEDGEERGVSFDQASGSWKFKG